MSRSWCCPITASNMPKIICRNFAKAEGMVVVERLKSNPNPNPNLQALSFKLQA